jgi:hypothetical protein
MTPPVFISFNKIGYFVALRRLCQVETRTTLNRWSRQAGCLSNLADTRNPANHVSEAGISGQTQGGIHIDISPGVRSSVNSSMLVALDSMMWALQHG